MARGHHEAARREFDEAQRLRPQDPEVLLNLSITLFHLGQFGPAEAKTRELLQEHDDSVPLLFNLGLILFKSGRDAEAVEPLQKVLALAPAHRKAHLTLGLIAQRAGAYDSAQKHFRLAGAELKDGSEGDDSVARTARAAAAEVRAATLASPASAHDTRPAPALRDDTKPTPVVKPEPLDSLASSGKRNLVSSGVRPRSGSTPRIDIAVPIGPFTPKAGGLPLGVVRGRPQDPAGGRRGSAGRSVARDGRAPRGSPFRDPRDGVGRGHAPSRGPGARPVPEGAHERVSLDRDDAPPRFRRGAHVPRGSGLRVPRQDRAAVSQALRDGDGRARGRVRARALRGRAPEPVHDRGARRRRVRRGPHARAARGVGPDRGAWRGARCCGSSAPGMFSPTRVERRTGPRRPSSSRGLSFPSRGR